MMHFYPSQRLVIFIDGANLYATAKGLGFDIDYKRLLVFPNKGSARKGALLYGACGGPGVFLDPSTGRLARLQRLHDVTKPTKEFTVVHGRREIKGSMDIELTVDAMRLVEHLDPVILFTGDGDFRALVAAMQLRGCRVSVVSTLQTYPPMVADELRRQADQFIDVADLETQICRDPSTRPVRESGTREARQRAVPIPTVLDYPEEDEDDR
jgi:uncharacterized LabA/DUF88 family protein